MKDLARVIASGNASAIYRRSDQRMPTLGNPTGKLQSITTPQWLMRVWT
jgi:hypothetical protein